ncbi:MAG: hypothetical protein IT423_12715 [Pirellulaceae bacterium]|nr:hypothetical protein [Pirellulaceae bacterium]
MGRLGGQKRKSHRVIGWLVGGSFALRLRPYPGVRGFWWPVLVSDLSLSLFQGAFGQVWPNLCISLHIHQTAADCLPSFEPEAMLGQGQGVESSGNPHAFVEFWGELCPECIFGLLFRLVKRYFFFAQNFIITP